MSLCIPKKLGEDLNCRFSEYLRIVVVFSCFTLNTHLAPFRVKMNTTMYIYSSTVLVQFWCVCTLLEYTHYFTTSATKFTLKLYLLAFTCKTYSVSKTGCIVVHVLHTADKISSNLTMLRCFSHSPYCRNN